MIRSILSAAILACLLAADASAADWPQFRCDLGRTAASAEQLPGELHLQWVRELPPPAPAFPKNVRLEYDTTYEPVVLGDTMFVPSMITESVTALDTASGKERWRFITEGPVRFAPAAGDGKVYFTSDDGYLYCLNAADGSLRWKFRGAPADKRERVLLGNGRLVSLWPARGGPVLDKGIVYFAAGLWPTYGVFVHALDAQSGQVVWSNTDSHHLEGVNEDHGIDQYAGLAPQGYLAIVGHKLVVPCGAQLPAVLDLKTGKLNPYFTGWGGRNGLPKGTWFVAGCGRFLSQSGDLYDMGRPSDELFNDPRWKRDFKTELYTAGLTRLRIDPTNHKDIGQFGQPVITPDILFENHGGIAALDLVSAQATPSAEVELPAYRKDDTYPDRVTGKFRELWRLPSKELKAQIKAGSRLYCTGPGLVAAIGIPAAGEEPRVDWQVKVEGTPHRLLAASGLLFVVTREGRILAYGGATPVQVAVHKRPSAAAPADDALAARARDALAASGQTEGYALVLGLETGRMVEELARKSNLLVIAIEPDDGKVAVARERLLEAGLYGSRVWIRTGDPLSYPLPPFMASLVVSERSEAIPAESVGSLVETVFSRLRPYGGTACARAAEVPAGSFKSPQEKRPAGMKVVDENGWVLLRREGALPGAADWSHEDANAASTKASTDEFVEAPLDLLWFDASEEWLRTPGATLVRVAGGRVLIRIDHLDAIDTYTGRQLWQADLPFKHAATDQMVTAEDAIYATGNKICLVLDPATGKERQRFELGEDFPGPWSNLRCCDDYLVATSGPYLLAADRHTGKILWRRQFNRAELSVAVGGGRVFCAELANPRRGEGEEDVKTRAIDIRSGEPVWEIAGGNRLFYCEPLEMLVTAEGVYRAADGRLHKALPGLPKPAAGKPATGSGPLFVVGDKL
ncbi:MAG: outer membrane protein assembly factor BamB family protein, partial [Thermoguttaceae bacterium]